MKDTQASGVNRIDVALIGEAEGRSDIGNRSFSRCVGQRRAVRSCAAFEEEFVRKIKMGQVDLTEQKSGRIVDDQMGCLRTVRGDSAALLFLSLVIDADPEPAMDRINLSRRRKRMSPDDIFEQSDFADAPLNRTCDPIGRLVVAMGIVSPADKEGSGSEVPHAISDDANRALGLFAFMGNEAVGEAKEEHLFWVQPKLRPRLFCLLFAERPQPVRRIGFAVRMRAGAITDNDNLSSQSLSASLGDKTSTGQALIVRMRRYDDKRPSFERLTQRAERKGMGHAEDFASRHRNSGLGRAFIHSNNP